MTHRVLAAARRIFAALTFHQISDVELAAVLDGRATLEFGSPDPNASNSVPFTGAYWPIASTVP